MSDMIDKMPPKVLLIDSDVESMDFVANAIERYRFNIIRTTSSDMGIRNLALHRPHLGVLSSRLDKDNFDDQDNNRKLLYKVVSDIRSVEGYKNMPLILMLDDEKDKEFFKDLDNGLIEFLERPIVHSELMRNIKELLRKSQPVLCDRFLKHKDVTVDLGSYKVFRQGQLVRLGPTEFKILELLIQDPKCIFSRQQIVDYVWGMDCSRIDLRTVDVHMNRLRSALKKVSNMPVIQTIRSIGYCLSLPGDPM